MNHFGRFITILLLAGTVILFAQEQKWVLDHTTRNYDQQHIQLALRLDFEQEKVMGTATLWVSPLEDGFRELILHSESTRIFSILIDGQKSQYYLKDGLLRIQLKKARKAGEVIKAEIRYTSEPVTGLYFFHPTKEIPDIPYQVWSQGEGEDNHHWFPCYDKPDDKLTSEIIVTVPDNMRAFSNGKLMEVIDHPDKKERTFHWKTGFVHSSYLISLVAGEYITVSDTAAGIPLNYNIPVKFADANPDYPFGRTPAIMKFFSDYIGPYPYTHYDQNPVQDFRHGGMENTTATTLNQRIFHDERATPNYSPDGLIAHELAHQWFGDLLTCKTWDHIWLNEGFATYFTDLFFEHYLGEDEFRKVRFERNRKYIDSLTSHPIDSLKQSKDGITPVALNWDKAYERGAAILHMLRYELGDDSFQKGIRQYVEKYSFQNVTSEDFRKVMEKVSGRDLSRFFKQWIYGAGCPEFEVRWTWNDSLKQMYLYVEQVQDTLPVMDVFQVTVPVEITADNQVVRDNVKLHQRKHRFTYQLNQKPDAVRFDKGNRILKKVHFQKSFAELLYQILYDNDVTGRYVAAEQLAEFGDRAVPVLKRAYSAEPFYWVRMGIVRTLAGIKTPESLAVIKLALTDQDERVREEAVKALGNFTADDVRKVLQDILQNGRNDYVRGAAAASLGAVKAENAFEALREMLTVNSHRNIIRRGVFEGMSHLKDSRVFPLIIKYTQYRYSNGGMHLLDKAALKCAEAMAEDYREEAIEVIARALKNPYFCTRNYAAGLLAKLNAKEQVPFLEATLQEERREDVRKKLEAAIRKLGEN